MPDHTGSPRPFPAASQSLFAQVIPHLLAESVAKVSYWFEWTPDQIVVDLDDLGSDSDHSPIPSNEFLTQSIPFDGGDGTFETPFIQALDLTVRSIVQSFVQEIEQTQSVVDVIGSVSFNLGEQQCQIAATVTTGRQVDASALYQLP